MEVVANCIDRSFTMRRGKFFIDPDFMKSSPELVMQILSRCLIIFCRKNADGLFEYWGKSMYFEELSPEDGTKLPEYLWLFEAVRCHDTGAAKARICSVERVSKGGGPKWVSCCPCPEAKQM